MMITQKTFDELVRNSERILTDMQRKLVDLEQRIKRMEERKKPGPKPKQVEEEAA
jgi:hypothetical protein